MYHKPTANFIETVGSSNKVVIFLYGITHTGTKSFGKLSGGTQSPVARIWNFVSFVIFS